MRVRGSLAWMRRDEALELARDLLRHAALGDVVVAGIDDDQPRFVGKDDAIGVARRPRPAHDPPKPRLMIFRSGNAAAVSHMRMVELPTKTISPLGGGDDPVGGLERGHLILVAVGNRVLRGGRGGHGEQ